MIMILKTVPFDLICYNIVTVWVSFIDIMNAIINSYQFLKEKNQNCEWFKTHLGILCDFFCNQALEKKMLQFPIVPCFIFYLRQKILNLI